ncbi:hypothetical protein J3R30DRAFT_3742540 [Lentinula aciculospora]|uniref:CsbD-like domain-containing protein n=1 Tax=Lentinula aciculospora TaxID=153920 RepID=A0A9W8ZSX2_9AGAR|nr:hypothetical protein J3R30DRAFT_3742540 [Lentinula aciculospora]
MPFGKHNNNNIAGDHTGRDTTLGAGAGGFAGHEGHHGHTGHDAAIGGFAGHEAGHHGGGTATGTHGNCDGLMGAGADGMRDAAIGRAGGEMLGRHQGRNAPNTYNGGYTNAGAGTSGVAGVGAGAGAGVPSKPSKVHGKMEEIEGEVERGVGKVAGSQALDMKGENKIISGQCEQAAVGGHRQADALEAQAVATRNRADAMHPAGGHY